MDDNAEAHTDNQKLTCLSAGHSDLIFDIFFSSLSKSFFFFHILCYAPQKQQLEMFQII